MREPTREQIREFWEWCGFEEIWSHSPKDDWQIEKYTTTNHWWEAPTGRRYRTLPDLDPNNLFKYAVPKLRESYPDLKVSFIFVGDGEGTIIQEFVLDAE